MAATGIGAPSCSKDVSDMERLFEFVIDYLSIWGYWAIMIGMALESACIPIPSELIFGFAGYLVQLGRLEFSLAVAAGVAGGLAGSIIAYLAGAYGGRALIDQYGKYIFLPKDHVALAQRWFDHYGIRAVFFSRLLPVVRTFISLPAGMARVHFGQFVLYTLLGSVPWTIALIYAGKLLGANWQQLTDFGHQASMIVLAGLALAAVVYYRKRTK
ncbi:membrane protein DedA, SNARE-associated domain [Dendrosporobacter quercicolus]|uniref:Membrane protein DedA, SNARE-associated domain n=2 Tax=Dendrosporobacter quercicolus TaxID=146817 RepID=A0A1G9SHX5_9FIRM|nr:membrane protein DedA, SNARE-associated domain [Dendrosporobacter quercicolus]